MEDKTSYNGPIPVVVNPTITVSDLKILVQNEFEFPVGVQVSILPIFKWQLFLKARPFFPSKTNTV